MKELTIVHTPSDQGKPARVRLEYRAHSGTTGVAVEHDFTFHFAEEDRELIRWYLEDYLQLPWKDFEPRAQQAITRMKAVGVELFDALRYENGVPDSQSLEILGRVTADLKNTRFVISANEAAGIALPWELMRNSAQGDLGDIALRAGQFVRSQTIMNAGDAPPLQTDTLNILLVVCRPKGDQIGFQAIAKPLIEVLYPYRQRLRIDLLRPPTFLELAHVLEKNRDKPLKDRYQVVHFDGHGTLAQDKERKRTGMLLFETEDGSKDKHSGVEFSRLLVDAGVSVVVLNACRSATADFASGHLSVANQLLSSGVRGVVAMTHNVYVQTAKMFMKRFYELLLQGKEVAEAVSLARKTLRDEETREGRGRSKVELRDWTVPVLFHAETTQLINAQPENDDSDIILDLGDAPQETVAMRGVIPHEVKPFIGRDNVLLNLEREFRRNHAILLFGMAGAGKTQTAMAFARWWEMTGALEKSVFFFDCKRIQRYSALCDAVCQAYHEIITKKFGGGWESLSAEQRERLTPQLLAQQRLLLTLDNVESIAGYPESPSVPPHTAEETDLKTGWQPEEQAKLKQCLASLRNGKTHVLLLSRRDEPWLKEVCQAMPLNGMTLSESFQLAQHIVTDAAKAEGKQPPEERRDESYRKLLERLDGNPLMLETVLPRLVNQTPERLLDDLKNGRIAL